MSDYSMLEHEWLTQSAPPPVEFADYLPYQDKELKPPRAQCSPNYTLMELPPPSSVSMPMSMPVPMVTSMPIPMPVMPMPTSMPMPMPTSMPMPLMPMQKTLIGPPKLLPVPAPVRYGPSLPRGENPRELRNKAEKQRRDKLNQSIAELSSMVPPVVASTRKIDKTGVLRLTAHYLRAHQYVFGESIGRGPIFSQQSTQALLSLLNGFLLTVTYKGLVVVVSQNVKDFLGHSELDLLGQSIFNITHKEDHKLLKEQLMPKTQILGPYGELIIPDKQDGKQKVAEELSGEKRRFMIRLKKHSQRTEPSKYVMCHVEGSLRKSDGACRGYSCCPTVRRARARGENPCSSGNDVVFVGVVRPTKETFINESAMESYNMEYRTRHSIDGMIIQSEQRIALVTGYMTSEVNGINAMNFIHRDEVRWVVIALQEMYNSHQLFGESCYRLMTKNGQFVYLRTRGRLDVDKGSKAITTFVCTNTLVDEVEGKHLIQLMKEKFNLYVNNNGNMMINTEEDDEVFDSQAVAVEDPRQIEKVILHLVTNLPSPETNDNVHVYPDDWEASSRRLALVPPKKERIVSAIEKIYTILTLPKQPSFRVKEIQPTDATGLPYDDAYLQNQSNTNTDTDASYNSVASDFDYTEIPVRFDNKGFVDKTEYRSSNFKGFGSLVPTTNTAVGTKRPNKSDEQEQITRKKIGVMQEHNVSKEASRRRSPSLEKLLDEALLSQDIQSAIDSLDQTLDPNFPDLLISKDLQDMLESIENETEVE